MEGKIIEKQAIQLRNVETFLKGYKKLSTDDLRNLDRLPYDEFKSELKADPVKVMVEASDLGMDLEQYGNLRSPVTRVEQGRSVVNRLLEDESIYVKETSMSAPSTVSECLDGGHRQALLYHVLTRAWSKHSIKDRSFTLPTSAPLHTSPNLTTASVPSEVAVGLELNPSELVATSHSVNTNSYSPFKWVYDSDDMKRNAVKPAEPIPASTLGESQGTIPMTMWGNRFVLPYEMLTGGQGMRMNKLASMVELDARADSVRQYAELLDVLESGDGVTGAAAIKPISGFGGTANTFDLKSFLAWIDEALPAPFRMTHVVMLNAERRDLRSALAGQTGNLTLFDLGTVDLAPSVGGMSPVGPVRHGRAPAGSITASRVVGLDSGNAVEKVTRSGMTIRQQAENIANQTRDVVVSDTYLWARLAAEAVSVFNVAG